ncbi:MAG: cupredoxin domain-containing protein [Candidatus Anstonellales archaeon]
MNKYMSILIILVFIVIGINTGVFLFLLDNDSNIGNSNSNNSLLQSEININPSNTECNCFSNDIKIQEPSNSNENISIKDKNYFNNENFQNVYVKALSIGRYDKNEIRVKKDIPVSFHFSAEKNAGCGKILYIDEFNVKLASYNGEESSATFTPTKKGTYYYHCGMWMFVGKLIVE